jgi:hypothetical protein
MKAVFIFAILIFSSLAKVVTNQCCGFWTSLPNEAEQTEFSTLNNETSFVQQKDDKAVQKNGNDTSISDKDVIIKPGGLSRAKLEKMRMANIKTAFMLSIVTLVFIVAFLPLTTSCKNRPVNHGVQNHHDQTTHCEERRINLLIYIKE